MVRALLYLRFTSFRNWLLWRVRRLRQPKYLVGAIVGVAYFYFFFFRRLGSARHLPTNVRMPGGPGGLAPSLPTEWLPIAWAIAAVVLLVIFTFMWVVPTRRAALGFTEAEIAFLFPAPLTRRALVHFRLLSGQARSLIGGLVMGVLANRWSFFGGNALTHAFGWWFVFSTLNLHFSGATFTMTRLSDRGCSTPLRRLLVLVIVAVVVGVTFWRLPADARLPVPDHASEFRLVSDWLVGLTTTAPLSWLLYPLRLITHPFLAPDTRSFLLALGPGLLVIALHYLWVVNSAVAFEESSIQHAERRANQVAAWRSGERRFSRAPTRGRPAPFRLAGVGRPEMAFLWKNLLSTWSLFSVRVLGSCAIIVIALSRWAGIRPEWHAATSIVGIMAGGLGAYVLVIGAQFARQDIRGDFQRIDILKTYPLAGWQIVLGELLAPTAILTGIVWLALLTFALNFGAADRITALSASVRMVGSLGIALLVPPIVLLQLLVPNAAALIFPGWAEATRSRGGGPEVMGQRMIYFFAQLLTIIVVLIPAALAGGVIVAITQIFTGLPIAITVGTLPVLVVLLAEIALAIWWLGDRFEKIDVSAELRS